MFFRVIHPWTPGQGQTSPAPTAAVRVGQVLDPLLGARFLASSAIAFSYSAILNTLSLFVVVFLLRLVLRRDWLAGGTLIVVGTLVGMIGKDLPLLTAAFTIAALFVFVTLLLALFAAAVFGFRLSQGRHTVPEAGSATGTR